MLDTEHSMTDCFQIDNGLVDKQQWSLTYTHFLLKKCLWAWQWCESYHAFQDMCYLAARHPQWLQDDLAAMTMSSVCESLEDTIDKKESWSHHFFLRLHTAVPFTWGKWKAWRFDSSLVLYAKVEKWIWIIACRPKILTVMAVTLQ